MRRPPEPGTDRPDRPRRRTLVAGGAIAASVAGHLAAVRVTDRLRHLGATDDEATRRLPGDAIDADLDGGWTTTRAVAIDAPAALVWPWLVQMGSGRAGWYALDRTERLLGVDDFVDGRSAWRIVPELQQLAVGDRVPMSDRLGFVVAEATPPPADPASLVLVLTDAPLSWVWTFAILPDGPERSRLVVRTRVAGRTPLVRRLQLGLDLGHAVAELVQLHGIRRRAEQLARGARGRR